VNDQLEFAATEKTPPKSLAQHLEDICRRKHGGNPESEEANRSTAKARDRKRVLEAIRSSRSGLTCQEISFTIHMPYTTCSARCSELLRDTVIIRKPLGKSYERRQTTNGKYAAVLILKTT